MGRIYSIISINTLNIFLIFCLFLQAPSKMLYDGGILFILLIAKSRMKQPSDIPTPRFEHSGSDLWSNP